MGPDLLYKKRLSHPLDTIEKVVAGHNWIFERTAQDEMSISIEGTCSDYDISFSWLKDYEALHIICAFQCLGLPPARRLNELYHLLAQINRKMVVGHFDYLPEGQTFVYRQALVLVGGLYPTEAQIEMLLITAIEACEGHYAAFQMLLEGKIGADHAMRYALFETLGFT